MKHMHLLLISVLALITPLTLSAEVPGPSENTTGAVAYENAAAKGEQAETRQAMHEHGMKHKGQCRHKKGKGGGKHGGGRHKDHEEVVQRLDMIEARMAKIELMLESLMKRR